MYRKTSMLALNFLIAITLIPVGVEIFGRVGVAMLGEATIALHPWLSTVFAYVPILVLLLIYLKASLEPFSRYGLRWSTKDWKLSLVLGVMSAIAIYGMDILFGILERFGIPADPSLGVAAGFIIALGILVPVTEELLFRGVIQTVFSERIKSAWKLHPAIFIAVAFEILMHLSVPLYFAGEGQLIPQIIGTLPQLVYVAVFGVLSGWVYQRTQSLMGPMLIHALGNAGELLLFWLLV